MIPTNWPAWERLIEGFLDQQIPADAAHDREHIRRVVMNATLLAQDEQADLAIVLPSAWLHDCVAVPKDSPLRSRASAMAGEQAVAFLQSIAYPTVYLPAIRHAIEAHSFSAGIIARTREAMVVQDADRLDSIGAIGVARCLMLSSSMGRRLYDPHEPFPHQRAPDDLTNAIDHFYTKLLRLADQMQTKAGRAEAHTRTAFMRAFLQQLGNEIGQPF
jgi:uncharacterized protein